MKVIKANTTRHTHIMRVMVTRGAMAKPNAPRAVKGRAKMENWITLRQQIFLKPIMAFEALLISCATADTGTATSTPKRLVMAGIIISPPLQPTAPDRKPPTKPIITKIRSTGIGFMFYISKVTTKK